MTLANRTGSDSRCCIESGAPYTWIHAEDPTHVQMVEFEEWLAGLNDFSRAHEEGEIDELFEAASEGKLEDTGDNHTKIKPVTHKPEIFELRLKSGLKRPHTYLRFYHSEPVVRPKNLIALHRHIKSSDDAQTDGLAQAISIHLLGESINWA
ncbi:hypothetical protein [Microbacterium sp. CR_7]|uniref:hypothetical protein n=1 Tax=Microbacterium sp. CR_7 TaxID=3055792 RepID=UPI0035C0CCD0